MSIERARLEVNAQVRACYVVAHSQHVAAFLAQTVTLDDNTIVKFEIW